MTGWAALLAMGQAELHSYRAAFADPVAAQSAVLAEALAEAAPGAFGREHGLDAQMPVAAFRAAVPVRDYAALRPYVDRIIGGESCVLGASPVVAFELTGGSTGGRKPVPYTAPLLDSFRRTILAWFGDFLTARPRIMQGRAYFAVSPALRVDPAPLGGLAVGLGSDLAYFGVAAPHLGQVLLHDPAIARMQDYDRWAAATAAMLAAAPDLTLASVWHASFLENLIYEMGGNALEKMPNLCMVSAWSDASSAPAADRLRDLLPGVTFQAKGLLATEGIFTFPLFAHPDPLPALRSAFLEFRGDDGSLGLVGDLQKGETYDLVVTVPGGFLRYAIGDRVICTGWAAPGVPMLRFVGRGGVTSDLVGEKLTEPFVIDCLARAGVGGTLAAVSGPPAHYDLWSETAADLSALDQALRRNPQYAHARDMRQLGPIRLRHHPGLLGRYTAYRLALGHRLADIKMPVLLKADLAQTIWQQG